MEKGITKLTRLLEGLPEQPFSSDEYIMLYATVYNLCTNKTYTEDVAQQLYDRYKETLEEHINTCVRPALNDKHDEFMLRELTRRWDSYKIMVRCLSFFFDYLDRYFTKSRKLPSLNEVGLTRFRVLIYDKLKNNVRDLVLNLIDREREGEQVDWALLKNVLGIFMDMNVGKASMEAYKSDIELPMFSATAAYYSRKAASWIEEDSCPDYMLKAEESLTREKERVEHYLHASTVQDLLEKVRHELLSPYAKQLLEDEHTGCQVLLRDNKVEDLSRMYRLSCKLPKGLEPIAAMFREHVTGKGTALVKKVEDAASHKKAHRKDTHGGEGQAFVRKVIELVGKYLHFVSECFVNHPLFQEAFKEAIAVTYNKGVAEGTTADLLAIYCDNLLKKGGSEELSDEAFEDTLEKVVILFACISEKDLFAEFYRKRLARRLLLDKSASYDRERSLLTKLKQVSGGQFACNLEGMVTDLTLARENQASFPEYLDDNLTSYPGIDLNVTVLTTAFWPDYKSSDLALPAEMAKCVEVFKEFYQTKTRCRKLTWLYSLGTCNINGNFDHKTIELNVTTYQAAVLALFNAAERLSYADIKGQLNLTDEGTVRLLHSLSCSKYKILNKDPSTGTVSPTDSFEFNAQFTDKRRRIKIGLPLMDEKKKVIEAVDRDRRYAIDACIVRIMKSRKALSHQQLVLECIEQLEGMFKPDIKVIKKRIEDLLAREYLQRDVDSRDRYRYLA